MTTLSPPAYMWNVPSSGAGHQKPQVSLSRVEPRPELAKIVMILSDDLRRVLPIRAKQAETQHLFESFRPGGKELITHGCPFRCMIEPAEREPRPRRTHALWSSPTAGPGKRARARGSGKLGTLFRDRKHGRAASCDIAQISIFIRGSAAPKSLGAGFALAG
jgi:hypothetical protein